MQCDISDQLLEEITQGIEEDTVFVFQGAGDISSVSNKVKSRYF